MSAPHIRGPFGARRRGAKCASIILPLLILAACGEPAAEPDEAVTAKLPPAETSPPQATALGPFPSNGVAQSPAESPPADNAAEEPPPAESGAAEAPTVASSRYTSLEPSSCTSIGDAASDNAAERRRCAGPLDYALETSDGGGQQDLTIIAPGGRRAELNLPKLASNARLGKTAEWRRDASGRPRALILRVDGAADQGRKVSDLVVTRLTSPPCVVAVIPRGPRQNEKARAAADSERLECMNE